MMKIFKSFSNGTVDTVDELSKGSVHFAGAVSDTAHLTKLNTEEMVLEQKREVFIARARLSMEQKEMGIEQDAEGNVKVIDEGKWEKWIAANPA